MYRPVFLNTFLFINLFNYKFVLIQEDFLNWPRVVQPLNTDCPKTPERVVTRSSPKKRTVKPSCYLSSPYENKPTKVIAMVQRIEFELGNSLFAMQGDKM